MRGNKPVILVEDDRVDQMTVRRAFRDLKITNPLIIAANGEEALVYLRDAVNPRPCLILLDLNMPRMNGLEFLAIAKKDEQLKMLPVVVLTTSREQQDRIESFRLSVAGYMMKPVEYAKFVEMVKTINFYWTLSEPPD